MTDYRIVEAKRWHCGEIIRRMSPRQIQMFETVFGNAHRAISGIFASSCYTRAWLIDGELAALGGVQGTAASSDGFVWLALSETAKDHKYAVAREARLQLRAIMATKSVIRSRIVPNDTVSRQFALSLGFRPGPEDTIEYRREWPATTAPFVVFSLPRSRSRWLAALLSHDAECSHDLPVSVASVDELCEAVARGGSVETGLTMAWWLLRERFPDIRFAVVRRPIAEIERSADHIGWMFPKGHLAAEAARLEEISALPGTVTVSSEDLGTFDGARRLYEHCTGKLLDRAWFDQMVSRNIQIDIAERTRNLMHTAERMRGLFNEIRAKITIQEEPFETFYRDAKECFGLHYAEAGSFFGLPLDPDVEMALGMEKSGQLLILTARQDGRIIGYIVYLLNRLFESRGHLIAFRNIWFVRKEFRGGLGIRLRKEAQRLLILRGVSYEMDRRGVRARGPHMDALYRREGAMDMGEIYMLPLVA